MGKLGARPKRAPRARDDSSDSDSGNALAKLREERRVAREKKEAEAAAEAKRAADAAAAAAAAEAKRAADAAAAAAAAEAARAADEARKQREAMEKARIESEQPLEMSDAEFLATLGLDADASDMGDADPQPTVSGPLKEDDDEVLELDLEDSKKAPPVASTSSSAAAGDQISEVSSVEGVDSWAGPSLYLEVLGEVLPMRLDREKITLAELTRYWETIWGIKYAARLHCSKQDQKTGKIKRLRNFEVIAVGTDDVLKVAAGTGAQGVLSTLSVALKRYAGKSTEQVQADREQQTEQRQAAVSARPGSELERFQREEQRRERLAAQIPSRFQAPAGNVMARVQLEKWNPASEKQAPKGQLRLPSRASPSDLKNFLLPGT